MNCPRTTLQPVRWLAHLPLAILPLLAAAATEGPALERALAGRVAVALAADGQRWASVTADGRDIEIRGRAPSQAALDRARALAAATCGVRRVAMHAGTTGR